jgi:hypothetical protein
MIWLSLVAPVNNDGYEPNGRLQEAMPITPETGNAGANLDGVIYPAGDEDFYEFSAPVGSVIDAIAVATGTLNPNVLNPVMVLYDRRGRVIAHDGNPDGSTGAYITYTVPGRPGAENSPQRLKRMAEALVPSYGMAGMRKDEGSPQGRTMPG